MHDVLDKVDAAGTRGICAAMNGLSSDMLQSKLIFTLHMSKPDAMYVAESVDLTSEQMQRVVAGGLLDLLSEIAEDLESTVRDMIAEAFVTSVLAKKLPLGGHSDDGRAPEWATKVAGLLHLDVGSQPD